MKVSNLTGFGDFGKAVIAVPLLKGCHTSPINCYQMEFTQKTKLTEYLLLNKPADQMRLQHLKFLWRQNPQNIICSIGMWQVDAEVFEEVFRKQTSRRSLL